MEQTLSLKTLVSAKGLRLATNPRMLTVLFMSFASGLPIALTNSTLQVWYAVSGVSIVAIGALTLVGQPYVYKFLWAPLLDRFAPNWLGRRRGWIFISQLALVITIALMAFMNPQVSPWPLALLALCVAFASATQDIAIDAYRTDLLQVSERGLGSAMTVGGYRVALLISGGLAMVLADHIGWKITYLLMAGLMLAEMLITYFGPASATEAPPPVSLAEAVIDPFREFLSRKMAWGILLFIVLYKLSDAFALSLGSTFLIRGVGFSLTDVGAIYKVVGIVATILGSFMGGFFMLKMKMFKSLLIFGFLQTLGNLGFMVLALVGKSYFWLVSSIFLENFCSGLGTVAFLAFLMSLCNVRYTATQFALLSALSAVGRVFIGPLAGVTIQYIGWAEFFLWSFIIGIPALLLLLYLKDKVDFDQQDIPNLII